MCDEEFQTGSQKVAADSWGTLLEEMNDLSDKKVRFYPNPYAPHNA
jgi:hypothetical protein